MYTTKEDLHKSVRWWRNICKSNPGEGESYPKDDMWKTKFPPKVDGGGLQGQMLLRNGGVQRTLHKMQERTVRTGKTAK